MNVVVIITCLLLEEEIETQKVIMLDEYEEAGSSSPTDTTKGSSAHRKPVTLKVEKGSGNKKENTISPDEGGDFILRFTSCERP